MDGCSDTDGWNGYAGLMAGLLHRTCLSHGVSREFGAPMTANDHEDVEYGQCIDGKVLESALRPMSPTLPVGECLKFT